MFCRVKYQIIIKRNQFPHNSRLLVLISFNINDDNIVWVGRWLLVGGIFLMKISSIFIWRIWRSVDYVIRTSRKILEKFLCQYSDFAVIKRRPKSKRLIFFNFLQIFSISTRLFIDFFKNLDKNFHIESKNIAAQKGLRIFELLNEAILSFFTYSRLRLLLEQKFCSKIILMSFENQCRIYRGFQVRSLIQNPSMLSRDITVFLAQLLQNRRFLENF